MKIFSKSSANIHSINLAIFFLLNILIQAQNAVGMGTLQHIQLFFRHGQRTPTSYLTFPTEPPPPAGEDISAQLDLGELTPEGMWQEYRLGMQLRSIYGQFLGDFYRSREINIYSGRDNRTVTSAQLVLASLFPPRGDQIWNRALLWQPIPVVTEPILDHPSFGMFDHCPAEMARVLGSKGYAELGDKFTGDIADLEAKTGLAIPDLNIFQKVQDAIVTRAELPKLLPLPAWARTPEFKVHINKARLTLHSGLIDLFLDGMGGWHFDQILGRIDDAVHNRTQQKAILYSSHDTNFLTIGRYLNIDTIDDLLPDYASFLAIELHRKDGGEGQERNEYFVEIKFHMGLTNANLTRLNIADCPYPCPLAKFRALRPRMDTAHWINECKGSSPSADLDDQCTLYGSFAGALLVLVVLLIASMFSLLLSYSYKRRYERMVEDEKTPLLWKGTKNTDGRVN